MMAFKGAITTIGALFLVVVLNTPATSQESPKKVLPEENHLIESLDGRVLFMAYCAACHGLDARGEGPAASELKTSPPDLTRISQRNGGRFPFDRVRKIISGEEASATAHGSRQMPIWGPIFSQIAWDQDLGNVRIYNLAKYIQSLQRK